MPAVKHRIKLLLCAAAASVLTATASGRAEGASPRAGVYVCCRQFGPAIPMQFGIIDGSTYANYDGETGDDVLSGNVLQMTSGPMQGVRYLRVATDPDAFRMISHRGAVTADTCPWQPGNAASGHW